jgi:hypothetical protein
MNSESYEELKKLTTEELYEFTSESDTRSRNQRKAKALHILEERRMKPMLDAAKQSSVAAKWAALAAAFSALISILLAIVSSMNNGAGT